jgi:hypothetical protein
MVPTAVAVTFTIDQADALLHLIKTELKQVPLSVGVTLETTLEVLDPDEDEFQLHSNEKGDRYWIPWTKEVGVWISQSGRQVELVVSQNFDGHTLKGRLMSGLSSVITGTCLNLQGLVAIHANAVCLAGHAVAFVGTSGKGKSTLSAYCASQGAGFITDDVLIVDSDGLTHPGNPRIKLYPKTGHSLGFPTTETTEFKIHYHPTQIGATIVQDLIPLKAIYFPEISENGRIYSESIAPSQAVLDLIMESYYASELVTTHPALFDEYVRLVVKASIKKLYYPREFSILPKVYEFLITELSL